MAAASAELIRAIATLLWPIFAFAFLWLFYKEIAKILRRLSLLKKGKFLGQEIELSEELDELQVAATKAEQETINPVSPPLPSSSTVTNKVLVEDFFHDQSKSPKTTLVLLAAEIEKRVREILAMTGWSQNIKPAPLLQAIDRLREQGSLPNHVSGSTKLFLEARNKIVHGHTASDEDAIRAIDSGLSVLRALEAIPTERNSVLHPGTEIYSDALCQNLIPDAKGVILETTSPGGSTKALRIFPTTRTHFRKGEEVAWEWSFERTWGPSWYKDPLSHELKQGWVSSAEFIGRHLSDL